MIDFVHWALGYWLWLLAAAIFSPSVIWAHATNWFVDRLAEEGPDRSPLDLLDAPRMQAHLARLHMEAELDACGYEEAPDGWEVGLA